MSLLRKQPLQRPRGAEAVIDRLDDILMDSLNPRPQDRDDLGTTAEIMDPSDEESFRRSTDQQVPTLDLPTMDSDEPITERPIRSTLRMPETEPPTRIMPKANDPVSSQRRAYRLLVALGVVALLVGVVLVRFTSRSDPNSELVSKPDITSVDTGSQDTETAEEAEPETAEETEPATTEPAPVEQQIIAKTAPPLPPNDVVKEVEVTFQSKPSKARVRLQNLSSEDKRTHRFRTPKTLSLTPAKYRISVSRPDYKTLHKTLTIQKADVLRFSLRPDMTNLE